ncbi:MAG: hypothetical protein V4667_00330 [Bacteroidota bacterium]|jgi:hypothetical protein
MKTGFARFTIYMGFGMIGLYLIAGICILFTNFLSEIIPPNYRLIMGVGLIFYAGFRFFMTYRMYKRMKQNEAQQNEN